MRAFYNPTTQERLNERVLYVQHGVTSETAAANGWFPFDISPIYFDKRFHYIRENGVVPGSEPDTYKIDWVVENLPIEKVRETLKKELAAIRYNKETDGIDVNGSTILTDRESQATISGAKTFSDINPAGVVNWKSPTGWVTIDATAILGIATAVGTHVQSCFTQEKTISEAIDAAATVEDLITLAATMTDSFPATAGVNTPKPFDPFNPI